MMAPGIRLYALLLLVPYIMAYEYLTTVPIAPTYSFSGTNDGWRHAGSLGGEYLTVVSAGGVFSVLKRGPSSYSEVYSMTDGYVRGATNGYWFVASKVGFLVFFRFGRNFNPLEVQTVTLPTNVAAQRLHMNRDNTTIVMVSSRLYIYNLNNKTWTQLSPELFYTMDMEENFVMGSVGTTTPPYLLAFAPNDQGVWTLLANIIFSVPLPATFSYNGADTIVSAWPAVLRAGTVFVHTRNNTEWTLTSTLHVPDELFTTLDSSVYYGDKVKFTSPTSFLVTGPRYESRLGAAVRYEQNGNTWEPITFIRGADTNKTFGTGIVADGDTVLFQLNQNVNDGVFTFEALKPFCYNNMPQVTCLTKMYDTCGEVTVTSEDLYRHDDTECGQIEVVEPSLPYPLTLQLESGTVKIPFSFQRGSNATSCSATLGCPVYVPPTSANPTSTPIGAPSAPTSIPVAAPTSATPSTGPIVSPSTSVTGPFTTPTGSPTDAQMSMAAQKYSAVWSLAVILMFVCSL